MTDKQVTSIFETSDYDKFKIMAGNRNINLSSVKKIEESIAKNGFKMCPILVNENFEIVDGQHRFTALKDLGLPIYYVIENGLNIEDCKILNLNVKNWSMTDFLKSYSDMNNDEYVKLSNFVSENKLSINNAMIAFSKSLSSGGNARDSASQPFYQGNFKMYFLEKNIKKVFELDKLLRTQYACHKWYSQTHHKLDSLLALRFFIHINYFNKRFDLENFLERLECCSNGLRQSFATLELIDSFGDFYNKGKRGLNKLDFNALYEEYKKLVPTGKFLENID